MLKRALASLLCSWALYCTPAIGQVELVVFTENSPPYQYSDNGNVTGLATARVKQIIERAGFRAQYKIYPWARALLQVQSSAHALIFSMAKTPERSDEFHWIAPVATFSLGAIALASRKAIEINDVTDLGRYSVAAQRGDIAVEWLRARGFKDGENLLLCADIVCSWKHLKLGTVDFIIEDPNLVSDTAKLVGLSEAHVMVKTMIEELSVQAYLAANKRMSPEIVQRLQQAAQELGYLP